MNIALIVLKKEKNISPLTVGMVVLHNGSIQWLKRQKILLL